MSSGLTLNFSLPDFSNPFSAMLWLFTHGGFLVVVVAFGYGAWWLYMQYIQNRFSAKIQYVLLAIDVPKENEQTPKAVEHIFSHFHGIHRAPNRREKYINGFVQSKVTIELVSIGGYIQYLVRAPVEHRDLVESAIYAQYPNADISEVEDYAFAIEPKFPQTDYDVWACELQMTNADAYPLKTYPLWEHPLTQTFLDPMASLLEVMGRMHPDEQIWLQWILEPLGDDKWRQAGLKIIDKLIGAKTKVKASALNSLVAAPGQLLQGTYETITRTLFEPGEASRNRDDNGPPTLMQHLSPNVRVVVEAVGMKISKLGFKVKARIVYAGKKEVFDKSRVSAIFGALKQYASMDMNGLKPDKYMKTARVYYRVEQRVNDLKRKLLLGYRNRSNWSGRTNFTLNTEELASVWHFPVITVKAPQVKKMEAKRGEPPTSLPIGELEERSVAPPLTQPAPAVGTASRGAAPTNLPIG